MEYSAIIKEYLLKQIANGTDGEGRLTNTTNLIEEGILNSFDMIDLIMFIEKRFGIDIFGGDINFDNFQTIEKICTLIHSKNKRTAELEMPD